MTKKKAYLLEFVLAVLGALCIKDGGKQRQELPSQWYGKFSGFSADVVPMVHELGKSVTALGVS